MSEQITFQFEAPPPTKGYPVLRWTGKRPYTSTPYYPAQLRETYGEPSQSDDWLNRLYWGDNLQVMSHLMRNFRGKVDLIYIDPPFDSKTEYKKRITVKGIGSAESDISSFEEKQYGDIWTNDEYLQFMYERLILMRNLLSDTGSIYVHLDEKRSHYIRLVLDEVFGADNFRREIIWSTKTSSGFKVTANNWVRTHDVLLFYCRDKNNCFHRQYWDYGDEYKARFKKKDENGRLYRDDRGSEIRQYLDELKGIPMGDVWDDIMSFQQAATSSELLGYPTQKPEKLVERIILASSNPGDLVFDCFMGSGTTQAVAMKLGRRFIGADINLGAVQTATKRLIRVAQELSQQTQDGEKYTGFEVYNVNNYDFFRNPIEARSILIQALDIQEFPQGSSIWDGELDGRMVKIMPVNRIATKADLTDLIANLPYKEYEKRKDENPNEPVERVLIVCMGHEPDLKATFQRELSKYEIDVEIKDILRDRSDIQLKRESEAEIVREGSRLIIREFYPLNLMQKLSLQREYVDDWRALVDSVMIDWNYDGAVMQPSVIDIPAKNELVAGVYEIPNGAGTIRVKITDLISESLEAEVR